ncbi:MAG: GNAT family N-acetyltransferase [Proteobacteria bacterium]|nr:GNAT family N-acetyltransferase [Pseudomonadota bacterium]
MQIHLTETPEAHAREVIASGLGAFNTERAGPGEWRRLAVLIQEGEAVTGGLWGVTSYGWLFTELLFVPGAFRGRGLGADIVRRAEGEARARGCTGAWLDTFEFQARGFYERLGYRLFGQIDDYPPGSARYFLKKAL